MFFVHALYLQPYLWPRTVPKRQEHNSGQQFTLYYDQLARGRFLFNFPKQKKGEKPLFALMSSNTTWPVSGRLRASPSAPAYARSCARPAGIRFAPGHVFTGRSSSSSRPVMMETAGGRGMQACIHVRAEFTTIPSYRGGTRAAPARLAMACYWRAP